MTVDAILVRMIGQLLSSTLDCDPAAASAGPWPTELDARGSAPPDHLSAILTAMAALPPGRLQFMRTTAEPTQLLRAVAAHGISASTAELPDGSWRTVLRSTVAAP